MTSETLVPFATASEDVAIVESGTSLMWELGRSTIYLSTLWVFAAEIAAAKTALDSSNDRLTI